MEKVISYSLLQKQANLEKLDLLSECQPSERVYAFYSSKNFCDAENLMGEPKELSNWMAVNLTASGRKTDDNGAHSTPRSEVEQASSPKSIGSPSLDERGDRSKNVAKEAHQQENLFSAASADEGEVFVLFTDHVTDSIDADPAKIGSSGKYSIDRTTGNASDKKAIATTYHQQQQQQQQQQPPPTPLATAAAPPQLSLCLGGFQLSTATSGHADHPAFSFHKQLMASNNPKHETSSSGRPAAICKTSSSSQLPPISDFQVSMKLVEEAETSALMDDGNPSAGLFGEDLFHERILVEPLNPPEMDVPPATWSIENVFNLSQLQNSCDDSMSPLGKDKLYASSHSNNNFQPFFADLACHSVVLPTSATDDRISSSPVAEQGSLPPPPLSFLLSNDPMVHETTDLDEKHAAYAWSQFGSFLDGLGQTNEDLALFGNYMTQSELENKREVSNHLDGDEDESEWSSLRLVGQKYGKVHSFQSTENFLSAMETEATTYQKLPKQLVARNALNLRSGGILCHDDRSNPGKDSKPLLFGQLVEQKREKEDPCLGGPRKSKRSICLWQFLKELLHYPESYQSWIRWVDKNKGVFKIEDSVSVARLWGQRKNKPAMNYDKLSRSIRQYYKKGIIKKTTSSKRLVYQFCPQYLA